MIYSSNVPSKEHSSINNGHSVRVPNPILLYKAIRTDNSRWVEGFYVEQSPTFREAKKSHFIINPPECHDISGGLGYLTRIKPETLCLAIGEYDVYGKEIFTGDIISYNGGEYVFEVCFGVCGGAQNSRDCGYNGFYFTAYDDNTKSIQKYGLRNDPIYWLYNGKCEIIGNIYDKKR